MSDFNYALWWPVMPIRKIGEIRRKMYEYKDQYEALHATYHTRTVESFPLNFVAVNAIWAAIEPMPDMLMRMPAGWIRVDSEYAIYYELAGVDPIMSNAPTAEPFVLARDWSAGTMVMQMYALLLGEQVRKLCYFGERGRPVTPPV